MLPLALSDDQLDTVMRGATPLPPQDRHKYLQRVAELLYQEGEIGDGAVARACREASGRSSTHQSTPLTTVG